MEEYHGHKTLADGTHVPLSSQEASEIWQQIEANKARREATMPSTEAALATMFDAFDRLRELGWRGGAYCPKDGSPFAAICHGSTGIFTGSYCGDWPDGHGLIEDGSTHPDGFLWKAIDDLTEWEEAARQRSMVSHEQYMERMFRAFAAEDETND